MKRLLLLISAMFVMTGIIAQDVYTSGHYTPSGSNRTFAAVYKNGQELHNSAAGNNDNTSTAVVVNPTNGDVYWTRCNESYGDVLKNNATFLNNGSGTYIHALEWFGTTDNNLRSAGYRTSGGKKYATIWCGSDTNPTYHPGYENGYESEAYGVVVVRTANGAARTYFCGYLNSTTTGNPRATVWRGGTGVEWTLSDNNSVAYDIAYYNGYFYTVGTDYENNATKLKVWRDNSELYTLVESNAASRAKIYVEAGDVYVVSYDGSNPDKVWKNGQELYTTGSYFYSVAVNSEGVFCAGKASSTGTVWKDGQVLYTISGCQELKDICLGPVACENNDVLALPFYEGFENGETDWACWTKIDSDLQNCTSDDLYLQAFWDRAGHEYVMPEPYSGDYCAAHRWGEEDQEGWLISPKIFLQPGRDNTTLTFKSYEKYASDYTYSGVWISTTTNNPSAFSEMWWIVSPNDNWHTVSLSLYEYQGQSVYIAFKYTGANGHNWYIDDVYIDENWVPCNQVEVPYSPSFDGSIGGCWYIIDNDMTGGQRNWKWNSSENCAYHPWGQQNMPQEGWLISHNINLPAGSNYTLTFDEKTYSSGANMKNSVLISVDQGASIPETSQFTEIWSESSSLPTTWTTRTIDLSAYAGHNINVAFKYEGTYAHDWYINNVVIDANIPEYNINVVANNPSWGTVTGGNTYQQGETVTITATPESGYDFLKWTKDGSEVSTEPVYTFTATENATYTAVFGEHAVTYYTIITEASPAEAGTVTGGDTYPEGTTATLAASANPGWQFVQWTDGNADNPRTITVTGDATYTAQFSHIDYVINVDAMPYEGGTVTGGGTYHYGDAVELTATPNEGYDFLNWDNGETSLIRTVIVDGDANYTAYFAEQGATVYTINVLSNNEELGTVTGGGTYPEGTVITITATPLGYANFVHWDDGSTKAERQITVTADATYTAIFEMGALYTITVESLNPEMGTVSGGGEFPAGAEIQIQATAFGGYHFNGWDDDNFDNPRIITVTGNATYKARFSQQQQETYHLTVLCNQNEGSVVGTGDYPAGTVVTIAAIPNAGFRFKEWNDGNTDNPRQITVNANATYFATFLGESVDENDAQSISLYPNPANEMICLEGLEESTEVRIYNTIGELVKVVNVNNNEAIRISDLATGLYIVRSGNTMLKFTKE